MENYDIELGYIVSGMKNKEECLEIFDAIAANYDMIEEEININLMAKAIYRFMQIIGYIDTYTPEQVIQLEEKIREIGVRRAAERVIEFQNEDIVKNNSKKEDEPVRITNLKLMGKAKAQTKAIIVEADEIVLSEEEKEMSVIDMLG